MSIKMYEEILSVFYEYTMRNEFFTNPK